MTRDQLRDQLRKALRDIDRAKISHLDKSLLLWNSLYQYRDAWRRHARKDFIVSGLRSHANFEQEPVS